MKAYNSRQAVAQTLEHFLNGTLGQWEWDDFVGVHLNDPELEDVRKACLKIRQQFPGGALGAWCAPQGVEEIRKIVQRLRSA